MARQKKPKSNGTIEAARLKRVIEMMAIGGKSGEEGEIAQYVRNALLAAGASEKQITFDAAHRRTPLKSPHGNLIFKLPGTIKGPRRLLMAHLDTVPICVGSQPVRKGSLIQSADPNTGLGADDRAGCAVVLTTALDLLQGDTPHPPLTFLWTIQEEIGLHGARCLSIGKLGKPAMAFNFDGGSPTKVTIGATGGYRMTIDVRGIASHAGGAPEQGVSAIAIASLAVADLVENGWHGLIDKKGKQGTSNVGLFVGGEATNVVTPQVTVKAEARSHDSKFREKIVREIESAFKRAAKKLTNHRGQRGSVTFDGRLDYDSFLLPTDHPTVDAVKTAIEAEGANAELAVTNGGLDANWMFVHGLPTVTMGCGQLNQHMVSEALDVDQYQLACRVARRLATVS